MSSNSSKVFPRPQSKINLYRFSLAVSPNGNDPFDGGVDAEWLDENVITYEPSCDVLPEALIAGFLDLIHSPERAESRAIRGGWKRTPLQPRLAAADRKTPRGLPLARGSFLFAEVPDDSSAFRSGVMVAENTIGLRPWPS
jgi:hypothetical protein